MTVRFEFLPADAFGLSDFARAARSGELALPGLRVARAPEEIAEPRPPEPDSDARQRLARSLEARLAGLRPHVAVIEAVRALAQPGTEVLLAVAEPGPFSGPLSGLWKAVSAIALARTLAQRRERRVVPLLWLDADGAQLERGHPAWFPNHAGELQRIGLASLPRAGRPASEIVFDEQRQCLPAVRALLAQLYGDLAHLELALELFVPRAGETFTSASARALSDLFGHHGLVLVEPAWLRDELSRALAAIVGAPHAGELAAACGSEDPARAHALVHHVAGGRRRALRAVEEGFRFDDEPGSRTPAELAAEIVQEPGAWSAGAPLLALLQERVLPVLARVGDEDELAREVRLLPLRARLPAPAPAFVLRSSVTLVDAECERALERLGTSAGAILRQRGAAAGENAAAAGPERTVARLRALADSTADELLAGRAELARLDPAFSVLLKRAADQLRGALAKLAERAQNAHANQTGTRVRHTRRLESTLAPLGELQEHVLGPFCFVARHGREWLDELVFACEPFGAEHLVVHLA